MNSMFSLSDQTRASLFGVMTQRTSMPLLCSEFSHVFLCFSIYLSRSLYFGVVVVFLIILLAACVVLIAQLKRSTSHWSNSIFTHRLRLVRSRTFQMGFYVLLCCIVW